MNDIKLDKLCEKELADREGVDVTHESNNNKTVVNVKCMFNEMTDSDVDNILINESKTDSELESLLEDDKVAIKDKSTTDKIDSEKKEKIKDNVPQHAKRINTGIIIVL